MKLDQLIKGIPDFIRDMLREVYEEKAEPIQYGRFHLGLKYDLNTWLENPLCGAFMCKEERITYDKRTQQKKTSYFDIYIIITEEVFLVLEPVPNMKNAGKMISWATLAALE